MSAITSRLSTALADRYKIERRLGEGGMATVYLAEDLKHDRKVALKVLRAELAAVHGSWCQTGSRNYGTEWRIEDGTFPRIIEGGADPSGCAPGTLSFP